MSAFKTGIATFALDYGRCPRWLFERMEKLAGILIEAIVIEFGPQEFLKRIADPVWFQSFGCLLAFDWNSSGLTVTTTAAIKEALKKRKWDLGIFVCGGKGKTSLKTPQEIKIIKENYGLNFQFEELSKIIAKIDNSLVQDGFNIYHHSFFFDRKGNWAVVQQGMNTNLLKARRYHWYGSQVFDFDVLLNDWQKVSSEVILNNVLNLASQKSLANRQTILNIFQKEDVFKILQELEIIIKGQRTLFRVLELKDREFKFHPLLQEKDKFLLTKMANIDFDRVNKNLKKNLVLSENSLIKSFTDILKLKIGPKTIRALSLSAEIIFGAPASWQDPARYTFAHGGKDGTPYFVDLNTYDKTIEILSKAINKAKFLSLKEKNILIKKVSNFS